MRHHAYAATISPQATGVYGQGGSFAVNTANTGGVSATSLNQAYGDALDSSGNLYVADSANSRVLYYAAGSTTATRVYGQAGSFTTNTSNNGGISANSLDTPFGVALDSSGNLYVADFNNSRVLYYAAGSTTATRVYGQAGSFTTNTSNNGGISATSLSNPVGMALDSSGDLYVTDFNNSRVLYYAAGSTTATRVYGQAGSFTTNTANNGGVSANSLYTPIDLCLDSSGNLYVADFNNQRVLYYAAGSTTATRVYGQAGSFTTNTSNNGGVSASSLSGPAGVVIDSSGNLSVSEYVNNRVLKFQTSLSVTIQPPTSMAANTSFTVASQLIDVGSAGVWTDFTGVVSVAIKSGTGSASAILSGTTPVSAVSGVATFSNLAIDTAAIGYILTMSYPGVGSANTNAFALASVSPVALTAYGQGGSFSGNTSNSGGVTASSLSIPYGDALDSSGNLYVADSNNNRVLYYAAGSTTATRVYGQGGSFTTGTANKGGISADSLNTQPTNMALDNSGNLYIADDGNNRVLYYAAGSTTATRVYGQGGSFTTNTVNNGGISATSLSQPYGVALDSSGNLYVAEVGNNRVLYYAAGSTTATRVYGQGGSFTTGTVNKGGISADSLNQPVGMALDSSGNLYVADFNNHRVLYYAAGSTTATRVYGQGGSFTANTANNGGISANSLSHPLSLCLDSGGNLYVTDFNNRVLYYAAGSTTATRVYGQGGSFTTGTADNGGVSKTSMNQPHGITIDSSGNLYETDTSDNRVLRFQTSLSITTQPPASTPATSSFTVVAQLIDVGSGLVFSDFTGAVSVAITAATGTGGAVLSGTSPVSAVNGVATFSNLAINLTGTGYTLTIKNPGVGSAITNTFTISASTLIAYWPLDEDSGTTAFDSTANHDNGTVVGATWTSGKINSGLSFNSSSTYVSMGTPTPLQLGTGSFSVITWFKTTSTSLGRMVSEGVSNYSTGFNLSTNIPGTCSAGCVGAELGGGTQGASVSFGTTATTFDDGNWHQAVMVIDRTAKTGQIYVDGVVQSLSKQANTCGIVSGASVDITTCTSASDTSTDPFTLGLYRSASGSSFGAFSGSLDEVRVYGSALSGPQILTLYNNDTNALSESATNTSFTGTPGSVATYTLPITVSYLLTPAPGWSLTITSTTLTSGGNTLPTTASSITSLATATCATTCTPTTLNNTISSFPMTIPAGNTAPAAVKFFGAAVGSGTGVYTVTPSISVTIPAVTRTGSYSSIITLTAASGP